MKKIKKTEGHSGSKTENKHSIRPTHGDAHKKQPSSQKVIRTPAGTIEENVEEQAP
ncbi:hypothetical protein [Bdellovibrio svalbardensis]|uniref:Uncharacterized protein n=1 Tax=Bdellovibrio svalbardensis TaxID=2972972 RepID=A0ABT6DL14_9BACT|nr:hypothetical protein [Bdellovibrio svalbardensis]MDG0817570.1 hypothetical protein [Bdellovibrio svalbardensis]